MKSDTKASEKGIPRRVTVSSGTVEAFIGRSMERARKMDRGERRRCQEFCVNGFRLVDDFQLHWLHLSGG
jgi:hypothetical protein